MRKEQNNLGLFSIVCLVFPQFPNYQELLVDIQTAAILRKGAVAWYVVGEGPLAFCMLNLLIFFHVWDILHHDKIIKSLPGSPTFCVTSFIPSKVGSLKGSSSSPLHPAKCPYLMQTSSCLVLSNTRRQQMYFHYILVVNPAHRWHMPF